MKKTAGFTLVELLIVVAILGALAGMVLIRFTGGQQAARDSRRQSDIRQYQNAIEIYANANNGVYPTLPANPGNAISLCGSGPLGSSIRCSDDPTTATSGQHYQYSATTTRYVLWARLEKTPNVFYVCSSGVVSTRAVTSWTNPTNGVCP